MKTEEARLKDRIKAYLTSIGAYWFMPVQNGMGRQQLDFICCISNECHRGRWVNIETKAPGKVPTPRQEATMKEVRAAGGIVFWCDNFEGFLLEMGRHNLVPGQFKKLAE